MATTEVPLEKRCSKCSALKPAAEFYKSKKMACGLRSDCKACYNIARRANYPKHRDKLLALSGAWRERNREAVRSYDRERYPLRRGALSDRKQEIRASLTAAQRADLRAAHRAWKAANPEKVKASWRRTYEKHREKHAARTMRWARNNPEARAAIRDRRRAAAVGAEGDHTKEDVRLLLRVQGRSCFYCDAALTKFHADHFIPLARGGSNGPDNLVLSCPTCNYSKGAKLPWEWMPARFTAPG